MPFNLLIQYCSLNTFYLLNVSSFQIIASIYLGVVVYQTTVKEGDETYIRHHIKVTTFVTLSAGFVVPTFLLLLVQLHSSSAENQKKSVFVSISFIF